MGARAIHHILRLDHMALIARQIERGDAHEIVGLLQRFELPAEAKIDTVEAGGAIAQDRVSPDLVAALRAFGADGRGA